MTYRITKVTVSYVTRKFNFKFMINGDVYSLFNFPWGFPAQWPHMYSTVIATVQIHARLIRECML